MFVHSTHQHTHTERVGFQNEQDRNNRREDVQQKVITELISDWGGRTRSQIPAIHIHTHSHSHHTHTHLYSHIYIYIIIGKYEEIRINNKNPSIIIGCRILFNDVSRIQAY